MDKATRRILAATTMGACLLGFAAGARAATYRYDFTFASVIGNPASASGSFDLDGPVGTASTSARNLTGTFTVGGLTSPIPTFAQSYFYNGGYDSISFGSDATQTSLQLYAFVFAPGQAFSGRVPDTTYGPVTGNPYHQYNDGSGLLTLSLAAPGSSSGSGSGGAPAPEVGTLAALLATAAVVVAARAGRRGRAGGTAAAA